MKRPLAFVAVYEWATRECRLRYVASCAGIRGTWLCVTRQLRYVALCTSRPLGSRPLCETAFRVFSFVEAKVVRGCVWRPFGCVKRPLGYV